MNEEARRLHVAACDDVDTLLGALADESWRVRKEAAARLAALPGPEAAPRLVELLGDPDVGRRAAAADALAALGRRAVPALLAGLAGGGPHRRFLVDALGAARDPGAVPALVAGLADDEENVRAAAAEALGAVGGDAAVAALRGGLGDASLVVRHACLLALRRLGAALSPAELGPLLREPMLRGPALALVGHTGDAQAVALLLAGLADPAPSVRFAALRALAALAQTAGEAVGAALRADPGVATALVSALETPAAADAARLLGAARLADAAGPLTALLADPRVEGAAAEALAAIGDGAVPALLEALGGDDQVAAAAAQVLGEIGAAAAVGPLLDALAGEAEVASAAGRALAGVGVRAPGAVRPHLVPLDARRCRVLAAIAAEEDRPALLAALREGDAALRAAAADGIAALPATDDAREALVFALADEEASVRAVAAAALGHIGAVAAGPALEAAARDPEPWVRAAAARALGQLRTGAPVLRELLRGGGPPAVEALEALVAAGDPRDAPLVQRALADDDPEMVKTAARSPGLAVAELVPLLGHPRWDVRRAAVAALLGRADSEAREALAAHSARETDPLVLEALGRR